MSLMALAALPGLGPVNIARLDRALNGSVESLLQFPETELWKWCNASVVDQLRHWGRHFNPEKVMGELDRMGADFVTYEEPEFPERLKPFADRPVGLYRWRAGKTFSRRCIAIVGTRQPSAYGRKVARELATQLSRLGFLIVSGLAEGIDTEAHRAALDSGGDTAAILGGGLKHVYPYANRRLMEEIVESGGVWSEFPLWRKADRRSFPQRNRIVSGVSEAVLVVESGEHGGSLITARMASEQGKPVYVVPGRVDSPASDGCHALIRDGACLVRKVDDILNDLNCLPQMVLHAPDAGASNAVIPEPEDSIQRAAWEMLEKQSPLHPDVIASELGVTVAYLLPAMLELELSGHVARRLDGRYERC